MAQRIQRKTTKKANSGNIRATAKTAARNLKNAPNGKLPQTRKTAPDPYQNSLAGAIGYNTFQTQGFPFNQGSPHTSQLSNVDTIFKNLRWYLVSNFRQVLAEAYVEIGLVQTIVDVPVDDAFRGGVEIKSKQLDEDQIEQLQAAIDEQDDLVVAAQATKWNRLFGGAGIIIMTDQDPSEPLDVRAIGKKDPLEFRAVDMWELFFELQNTEGELETSVDDIKGDYYNYYGVQVHKSRVLKINGLEAPSFIRPRLRGWGYSEVEKLVRSINQYLKSADLGFEVLDEFKLDVYKMKNLVNTLLTSDGETQVMRRIQMANWQKNYQNAVVLDSEDEFDHKQLSFQGLADAMAGIRMQIASDMRMPLTKLFGISAAGFNSGDDDIEVYNSMIESTIRTKIKWHTLRIIQLRSQQLFNFVPDDLKISFKPLRILSAAQEEEVKNSKFTRLLQAKQSGEITRYEFREGCNKDTLLSVTLDNSGEELNFDDPDVAALVEGEPEVPEPEETADSEDEPTAQLKKPSKSGKPTPDAKLANNDIDGVFALSPIAKLLDKLKPFSASQALERSYAVKTENSAAFDRASYAADGGDSWIDPRRREFFQNPGKVDEGLWAKAKDASMKAFGKEKWQFITWWYKKHGGKFH